MKFRFQKMWGGACLYMSAQAGEIYAKYWYIPLILQYKCTIRWSIHVLLTYEFLVF